MTQADGGSSEVRVSSVRLAQPPALGTPNSISALGPGGHSNQQNHHQKHKRRETRGRRGACPVGAAPSRRGFCPSVQAGERHGCRVTRQPQPADKRARTQPSRGPPVLLAPTEGPARVSSDTVTSPGFAKANERASQGSRVWRGACGGVASRSGSPASPASKQRPGSACPTDDPLQRGATCAGRREGRTGDPGP